MRDWFEVVPTEWIAHYNKAEHWGLLRDRTRFLFMQLRDHRAIRGLSAIGCAWVEESTQVHEKSYDELTARLRLYDDGQIFGTTNPDGPEHYLYKRFADPATRREGHSYYQGDTRENIFLPTTFLKDLQQSLTGPDYERYIRGEWVLPGNRIFRNWDDSRNYCDPVRPSPFWRTDLAIDWGYEHWFCCLWITWPTPDRFIVYRELFMRQAEMADIGERIYELSEPDLEGGIRYETAWSDHDPRSRAELRGLTVKAHRITTRLAIKERTPGLRCVNGMWLPRDDGFPGGFITKDCPKLRDQVVSLRRPDGATKEDDVVEYGDDGLSVDDGPDALRYGVYSRLRGRFDREVTYNPGMSEWDRKRLMRLRA